MGAELGKAAAIALVSAWGSHALFSWLTARGGLFVEQTDIDPKEFFPALFTVAMIAGVLS